MFLRIARTYHRPCLCQSFRVWREEAAVFEHVGASLEQLDEDRQPRVEARRDDVAIFTGVPRLEDLAARAAERAAHVDAHVIARAIVEERYPVAIPPAWMVEFASVEQLVLHVAGVEDVVDTHQRVIALEPRRGTAGASPLEERSERAGQRLSDMLL